MSHRWHEIRLQQEWTNPSCWFLHLEEKRENPGGKCLSPEYSTEEIPEEIRRNTISIRWFLHLDGKRENMVDKPLSPGDSTKEIPEGSALYFTRLILAKQRRR